MCWSKDLTPKPLLLLLFRAPPSWTGVEASGLSFQSCGETRLLCSDLYWIKKEKNTTVKYATVEATRFEKKKTKQTVSFEGSVEVSGSRSPFC